MAANNVRIALVVPMSTYIITFERYMYSIAPLTLVPQVGGRENDLSNVSYSHAHRCREYPCIIPPRRIIGSLFVMHHSSQ